MKKGKKIPKLIISLVIFKIEQKALIMIKKYSVSHSVLAMGSTFMLKIVII